MAHSARRESTHGQLLEALEPRVLCTADRAEARPIPILVVPGLMESVPRKLDVSSFVKFIEGETFAPDALGFEPGESIYWGLMKRLDALPGYQQGKNLFFASYDSRLPVAPVDHEIDGLIDLHRVNFTDRTYNFGVEYIDYWIQQARRKWVGQYGSSDGFRVNIVAHGLGGIETRALIQSERFNNKYLGIVNQVITVGTPHRGMVDAFLQRDTTVYDFLKSRGVSGLLLQAAKYSDIGQQLLSFLCPPLGALFPVFDFVLKGTAKSPASGFKNSLLSDLDSDTSVFSYSVTQLTTLGSTGLKTAAALSISDGTVRPRFSLSGDSLVLGASSLLPSFGMTQKFRGLGNAKLVQAAGVVGTIAGMLFSPLLAPRPIAAATTPAQVARSTLETDAIIPPVQAGLITELQGSARPVWLGGERFIPWSE